MNPLPPLNGLSYVEYMRSPAYQDWLADYVEYRFWDERTDVPKGWRPSKVPDTLKEMVEGD